MDRREWPPELWMARCDDEPNYYISVGDCPRLPTDRRYVLADWIFVDDRLPEPMARVNVYVEYPEVKAVSVGYYCENRGWTVAQHYHAPVLAWMPLPSPPTAEQIASYRTRTEGAPSYDD